MEKANFTIMGMPVYINPELDEEEIRMVVLPFDGVIKILGPFYDESNPFAVKGTEDGK